MWWRLIFYLKLNYAINQDILKLNRRKFEKTTTKSDFFLYISALEDDRVLVTVNTSVESNKGDKEFRRLDLELDVLCKWFFLLMILKER